jgi:hypothetical protein
MAILLKPDYAEAYYQRASCNRPRTEPAGGVTIAGPRQQQRGRIRFAARVPLVAVTVAGGRKRRAGGAQNVAERSGGQPCAQSPGQNHRGLASKLNPAGGPEHPSRPAAGWSNHFHCSCSG